MMTWAEYMEVMRESLKAMREGTPWRSDFTISVTHEGYSSKQEVTYGSKPDQG